MKDFFRKYKNIIIITLSGFLIRISGTTWGFPGILHNDESNVIRSSLGMRFGDFNPHHFDWPSLYFYINYFVFWVFIKVRIRLQVLFGTETMKEMFPFWWGPDLPFYWIGRFLAVVFSTLTIILIYKLTKKIFKEEKVAVLSSLFFALSYYSVYFSFYALSDTALTFFILLSIYFCIDIIKKGNLKYYLLAGLFAGLATSTKYHGVLVCGVIFIAHLFNKNKKWIIDKKLITAAAASIIFFFIGTPYALLDYETFLRTDNAQGALWQVTHMGQSMNWGYYFLEVIPNNFGILLGTISLFGIYKLSKSKDLNKKLLSISFILFVLYIGTWGIARWHYGLPFLPILSISAGYAFFDIQEKINKKYLKYILLIILLLQPTYHITIELIKRTNKDTRVISGQYIEKNIPKDSHIFLSGLKTGYYGGNNPIFEWEDYKIHRDESLNKGYEINFYKTSKKIEVNKNCELFDNKYRTGPKITICARD